MRDCPKCGISGAYPHKPDGRICVVNQLEQAEAAVKRLLVACRAVLHAMENVDLGGIDRDLIFWILPPWQDGAVHETVEERLRDTIRDAEADLPLLAASEKGTDECPKPA